MCDSHLILSCVTVILCGCSCDYVNNFAGINRTQFDNKVVTFEEHLKKEHNMWDYLKFIVLLKVKDPTEFTGPESYVYNKIRVRRGQMRGRGEDEGKGDSSFLCGGVCHYVLRRPLLLNLVLQGRDVEWFPRMQAMSLQSEEVEGEQNEIALLRSQLTETNELVKVLSAQLGDLRQRVGFSTVSCSQ